MPSSLLRLADAARYSAICSVAAPAQKKVKS
jgi:hypothetical protein